MRTSGRVRSAAKEILKAIRPEEAQGSPEFSIKRLQPVAARKILEAIRPKETQGSPESSVKRLQPEVVSLLQEVHALLTKSIKTLGYRERSDSYAPLRRSLLREIEKVRELELRMAVVAPMKAGKSTLINAIVGQEIVPARSSAMTTLPTEIVCVPGKPEPELFLSSRAVKALSKARQTLRQRVKREGLDGVLRRLGKFTQIDATVRKLTGSRNVKVPSRVVGAHAVRELLREINDISRIASVLNFKYRLSSQWGSIDVPRVCVSFSSLRLLGQNRTMGKLVLVDTPGADEEALYSELEPIVEEQLKGSSAVLLVIDFTQRDNRAVARVRDQVREVVDVLGNDHLLVVVNKIDERRSKDDPTWEDFVRSVRSIGRGFDIESSTFRNQMFEVSARRAFRATECLHTLRTNPSSLPVSGLEGVSLLLEEMHPFEWQKILTTITAEEVETKCQLLWENSAFLFS